MPRQATLKHFYSKKVAMRGSKWAELPVAMRRGARAKNTFFPNCKL